MKILDPNLADGVHEWRNGRRFVKEGEKLYLEGSTTLAGRYSFCFMIQVIYLDMMIFLVLLVWINVSEISLGSLAVLLAKL